MEQKKTSAELLEELRKGPKPSKEQLDAIKKRIVELDKMIAEFKEKNNASHI